MFSRLIFRALFLLPILPLSAQPVDLQEAITQNLVQLRLFGLGGYEGECVGMMLSNSSNNAVQLRIPPGQMFVSADTNVQDLVHVGEMLVNLSPAETTRLKVKTMCTQSGNMGPSKGESFGLGAFAAAKVLRVAQFIADKGYQGSSGQLAIWAAANGGSNYFGGDDTAAVNGLFRLLTQELQIPISRDMVSYQPVHITSFNTSFDLIAPKDLAAARLVLVDEQGNEVQRYFSNRAFEQGFWQLKVGVNHILGDSAKLWFKLYDGDVLVSQREVFSTDSIAPTTWYNSQVTLTYKVNAATKASAGVYDGEDRLLFWLKREFALSPGYQRNTFIMGKELPADAQVFVKVKNDKGEVLADAHVNPESAEPVLQPKRKAEGIFRYEAQTEIKGARFAVFDENDQPIRVFFENSSLYPGAKQWRYSFEHRLAPGAAFYLRLYDGEGKLLKEEAVRQ